MKYMALAVFSLALAHFADADTLWDLNATFVDGGTATGTFSLSPNYAALTAWDITISPFPDNPAAGGFVFDDSGYESIGNVSTGR